MKTALVLMTILGCDDTATQCHYISTVEQTYASIEICDAQAETQLDRVHGQQYPTLVAACETQGEATTEPDVEIAKEGGETTPLPAADNAPLVVDAGTADNIMRPKEDVPTLKSRMDGKDLESPRPPRRWVAHRVMESLRNILPERKRLAGIVEKPVHVVTDGYAWVAKRLDF